MCLATGIWPAHLNVCYHFMRVTLKLEELYGAVSLLRIVLETKGLIFRRYGFSEDDLTCARLKLKFQRIFVPWDYKGHSMDPLPISYKYSVWNSDSDYYLVLFWCKCILNLYGLIGIFMSLYLSLSVLFIWCYALINSLLRQYRKTPISLETSISSSKLTSSYVETFLVDQPATDRVLYIVDQPPMPFGHSRG